MGSPRALAGALGLLLSVVVCAGADQTGVWTPIGPRSATVWALERAPAHPSVVYAGLYFGGLYRSQDGGIKWAPVPSPFSMSAVFGVAVHPIDSNIVYVATFDQGAYKTADNGVTWEKLPLPSESPVQAVAVDPAAPQTVLVATHESIFRSTDGGVTWQAASGDALSGVSFLFSPSTSGLVYVGTSRNGVFESHDSGLTWTALTDGLTAATVIKLDPDTNAAGAVLASTAEGVFRLAPGGSSWQDLTFDLPLRTVGQTLRQPGTGRLLAATDAGVFALDPAAPTHWADWSSMGSRHLLVDQTGTLVHVAATTGSLQVTGNNGATFFPADYGMQNRFVEGLTTVNAWGQTLIYASTDIDVLFTTESFRNSVELPWAGGSDRVGGVFSVAAHPTQLGTLFSATEGYGVWKSTDFGLTWNPHTTGIVPSNVLSIDQSAVGARTVYAGTSYGVFASNDNGQTWNPNIDTTPRPVTAVLADPVRDRVAFYGTGDGEVFRTYDGGRNFHRVWAGVGRGIQQLAAARFGDTYAITTDGQLYSSDDLGVNFYRRALTIEQRITSIVTDPGRPWVLYIGTIFGGVYKSESTAIEWTAKNSGLDVPIVLALAINPSNPEILYAGSLDAVYRTADGGNTWQRLSSGLPPGPVTHLSVDPGTPQTIYASVAGQGLFRSNDSGQTWSAIVAGPIGGGSTPVVAGAAGTQVVFHGSAGEGIYRSTDLGTTWVPSNDGLSLFIKDIAIDPIDPQRMYAASLVDGVFRTTDGGSHWTRVGLVGRFVLDLTIDPHHPRTIFAGTPSGTVRSVDGGDTWVDLGQRMAYTYAIATDSANPSVVYVGGNELYRSADSGRTWTLRAGGLPREPVTALVVDASTQRVYAGFSQNGVHVSADNGISWAATPPLGSGGAAVSSLAVGCDGVVYAGTLGGGLYATSNHGESWTGLGQAFPSRYVSSVAVDPTQCARLLVGLLSENGDGAGLFVSTNAGTSWAASSTGLTGPTVHSLTIDPTNPALMAAATPDGVFTSQNSGASWQKAGTALDGLAVRHVLIDQAALYAGTEGHGLYRSTNGGTTWVSVASPFADLLVTGLARGTASGGPLVASGRNGVLYIGSNGLEGGTEATVAQALVYLVAPDPVNVGVLYAATGGQGVIKSTDGGITWRAANNGLTYPFLIALVVDPVQSNTLYAGTTGGGVLVSDDGAQTWHPLNQGLFHQRIASLAIDVNDHRTIYAGTEGGSVFRLRR